MDAAVTVGGRLFQALVPAAEKDAIVKRARVLHRVVTATAPYVCRICILLTHLYLLLL